MVTGQNEKNCSSVVIKEKSIAVVPIPTAYILYIIIIIRLELNRFTENNNPARSWLSVSKCNRTYLYLRVAIKGNFEFYHLYYIHKCVFGCRKVASRRLASAGLRVGARVHGVRATGRKEAIFSE